MPVRLMFLGRANTDGDLVAWLPSQKVVVTGDIVVSPYPFGFGSYPADWIDTLGKIKALGFATLIPGHGKPQRDSAYLDKLVTVIAEIRRQVAPLAKQGLSLEEVRKKVDFSTVGELFGSTPRDEANFQGLFADPMTKSAYHEGLGQPIIQGELPEGYPKPRFTEKPPRPTSKKNDS
jgi:glyoxylase-like metal-dependent hydrolase (beta-lactamase superfamily II)